MIDSAVGRPEASCPRGPVVRALDSLHGRFVASVLLRGAGAVLALTINVLLARMLGVVEYGRYMTLLSAALLLGGLAVRGSDQLLTRELAGGASTPHRCLARWTVRRVALSTLLAVPVYLGWVIVGGQTPSSMFLPSAVLSGTLLIGLSSFCMLQIGALNGLGASLRSQSLVLVVQNSGVLALLGGMLWSVGSLHGAEQALWLQVGAYLLAMAVGWLWLRALTQGGARGGGEASVALAASAKMSRRWSIASRHFMLVTVASMLVNRLDVVLVSALAGNETAGVYAAGARLAQVALMVALAVNVVLSPRIAAAWARGDRSAVHRLVRSGLAFTVPIALIEMLAGALFASDVAALFGPAYAHAAEPFAWVVLAYALWTVAAPLYVLLAMTGSEKAMAAVSWLVLITNVASILLLVPLRGATGAGMAMTTGFALALPVLMVLVRKKIGNSVVGEVASDDLRVKAE